MFRIEFFFEVLDSTIIVRHSLGSRHLGSGDELKFRRDDSNEIRGSVYTFFVIIFIAYLED